MTLGYKTVTFKTISPSTFSLNLTLEFEHTHFFVHLDNLCFTLKQIGPPCEQRTWVQASSKQEILGVC